jgi:hypothetical protein
MELGNASARLITLTILIAGRLGAPAHAATPTLCQTGATPVFTCGINSKTVSVCQSKLKGSGATALEYRYGVVGQTPELVYPAHVKLATEQFSFTTIGGPIWVISFKSGNATYDVMSNLSTNRIPKNGYDKNFTGIGVSVNDGPTQLKSCNAGDVIMDMRQLNDEGLFPRYAPSVPYEEKSPFQTVSKTAKHGTNWTSTIEYSVIGDTDLDQKIKSFTKYDCVWDEAAEDERREFGDTSADTGQEGGKCSRNVRSYIVQGKYLVLIFLRYTYNTGAPHGEGEESIKTFVRDGSSWTPIVRNSLISDDPVCHKHYAALINRRIRPQLTDELAAREALDFDSLFEEAEQVLTPDGVLFHFPEYSLGPRVSPEGILVDFKTLAWCFAPRPGKDDESGGDQ